MVTEGAAPTLHPLKCASFVAITTSPFPASADSRPGAKTAKQRPSSFADHLFMPSRLSAAHRLQFVFTEPRNFTFWLYALLTHREPWTRLLYQPRAVEGLWILPWIHYPVSPQALFLEEGLTCPGEELNGRNVYISRLPVSALKVNLTISLFQHHYRSYWFEFHVLCQLGSLWFVCSSTPHAILLDCLARILIFT